MTQRELSREIDHQWLFLQKKEPSTVHQFNLIQKLAGFRYIILEDDILPFNARIEALLAIKGCLLSDIPNASKRERTDKAIAFAYHNTTYYGFTAFAQKVGITNDRLNRAYNKFCSEQMEKA